MRPIQLISFDSSRKLQVNSQAHHFLEKLAAQKQGPLGVITVVGRYRTGKSFLLNRVLLGRNSGFEVGPTINACTKGLWVWPELIHDQATNMDYLIVDTEGLGSLEEGEQSDCKIFLMALLLSSYLIYNSVGSIDEKALQSLNIVVNLSKLLQRNGQLQEKSADPDFLQCFPSFLWVVRDFALRLVDEGNHPISAKIYLENALRQTSVTTELAMRKNAIRKQLCSFFKERDCFTLIMPVDDERKLQVMATLPDCELRPQFLEAAKNLRGKIFSQSRKKMFKGRICNVMMFLEMCKHFVKAVNEGNLPQIENNWESVCRTEIARIARLCEDKFLSWLKIKSQELAEGKSAEEPPPKADSRLPATHKLRKKQLISMREFDHTAQQKITELVAEFQSLNLLSPKEKQEKKVWMHNLLNEHFVAHRSGLLKHLNDRLDQSLSDLLTNLHTKISLGEIKSIFCLTEPLEDLLTHHLTLSSQDSQVFLYQRIYQTLKELCVAYFALTKQTDLFEKTVLSERLGLYEESLNRLRSDYSKRIDEGQERERALRNQVILLQMKASRAIQEFQNAKKMLALEESKNKVRQIAEDSLILH